MAKKKQSVLTCKCSVHGEQKIAYWVWAGMALECGCLWKASPNGLVFEGCYPSKEKRTKPAPAGGEARP